jgi:hypothetical protein
MLLDFKWHDNKLNMITVKSQTEYSPWYLTESVWVPQKSHKLLLSVPVWYNPYSVIKWINLMHTHMQAQGGSTHHHSSPPPSGMSDPWDKWHYRMGCDTHTRDSGWMTPARTHSHSQDDTSGPDIPGPRAVLHSLLAHWSCSKGP